MVKSFFIHNVYALARATVAGPKEKEGPLGLYFDKSYDDHYAGQKSFEEAEMKMMEDAINLALNKEHIKEEELDFLIAGDLNNQIACSSKIASNFLTSFIGIYGACSTSMLGVALSALLIDTNLANKILIATSSSLGTAERQFRYPNEYGLQKKVTTTITASGCGALILGRKESPIRISEVTFGKVSDADFKNVSDMGTCMSLAAYETISSHINNLNKSIDDYDLILTGDLSKIGSLVLKDLFKEDGIDLKNHADCGNILFDKKSQKVFCGGSGAACCPLVTYTEMFMNLLSGRFKRIMVVATGALHDTIYVQQKKSIPSIAHAVTFERS